ncbi:MAG: VOC family protein [Gammaproteobacteria bacterium]|nr:VOC family protein [Gammaproteobacteria bacterium]
MSNITKILHASFIVNGTEDALSFYCGVLEFEIDSSRPDLGYPGAWLNVGDGQIHLLELPNPDPVIDRPEHGGRDRHLAMQVESMEKLKARLSSANILYTESKSGRKALFCRDPDGNALEFVEK